MGNSNSKSASHNLMAAFTATSDAIPYYQAPGVAEVDLFWPEYMFYKILTLLMFVILPMDGLLRYIAPTVYEFKLGLLSSVMGNFVFLFCRIFSFFSARCCRSRP